MVPRIRLYLTVAAAAIVAAGLAVGLTLDTRTTPHQPAGAPGKPPIPRLSGSVGAEIVAAFSEWPHGSIDAIQRLGLQHAGGKTVAARRTSSLVQYYRGVALLWAGYPRDAEAALQLAKKLGTNTIIHNRADNLLHPNFFQETTGGPGYPVFIPIDSDQLLARGSQQQEEGHQVSAEALYARAVKLHPESVDAKVAAAVGLFDEDNLTPSFSRLGPLSKQYPSSQIVHYYLALLLAWTSQGQAAIAQFQKVVELDATSKLGKTAAEFLKQPSASSAAGTGTSTSG